MPTFYDSLPDDLRDWALEQSLFFIASAPLAGRHINLSPKGLPRRTFAFFDGNHAAYIDHSGSGAETMSHMYENGRATIMFCSFGPAPRIMRLFCTGHVVEFDQPGFVALRDRMGKAHVDGARAIILLDIFKVQTACGFGVPLLNGSEPGEGECTDFMDRDTLDKWTGQQLKQGKMGAYIAKNNTRSLDGLTGMKAARRAAGEVLWFGDLRAWLGRLLQQREALCTGAVLALVVIKALQYLLLMMGSI